MSVHCELSVEFLKSKVDLSSRFVDIITAARSFQDVEIIGTEPGGQSIVRFNALMLASVSPVFYNVLRDKDIQPEPLIIMESVPSACIKRLAELLNAGATYCDSDREKSDIANCIRSLGIGTVVDKNGFSEATPIDREVNRAESLLHSQIKPVVEKFIYPVNAVVLHPPGTQTNHSDRTLGVSDPSAPVEDLKAPCLNVQVINSDRKSNFSHPSASVEDLKALSLNVHALKCSTKTAAGGFSHPASALDKVHFSSTAFPDSAIFSSSSKMQNSVKRQDIVERSAVSVKTNTVEEDCPLCASVCQDVHNLQAHVRAAHQLHLCKLCRVTMPCDRKLIRRHSYAAHKIKRADQPQLACPKCPKMFYRERNIAAHMQRHSKGYSCFKCGETFVFKHMLSKHRSGLGPNERPYACTDCDQRFRSQAHLDGHMNVHNGKGFKCDLCTKVYPYKGALVQHQRYHSNERPFKCAQCSKAFRQKNELSAHIAVQHMNLERKFVCSICGWKTYSEIRLRKHTPIHGERRHACGVCESKFKTLTSLRNHLVVHSGERKFKCDRCEKHFPRIDSLKNHIRAAHTGERPFVCQGCGRGFTASCLRTIHKRHCKKIASVNDNARPVCVNNPEGDQVSPPEL